MKHSDNDNILILKAPINSIYDRAARSFAFMIALRFASKFRSYTAQNTDHYTEKRQKDRQKKVSRKRETETDRREKTDGKRKTEKTD